MVALARKVGRVVPGSGGDRCLSEDKGFHHSKKAILENLGLRGHLLTPKIATLGTFFPPKWDQSNPMSVILTLMGQKYDIGMKVCTC